MFKKPWKYLLFLSSILPITDSNARDASPIPLVSPIPGSLLGTLAFGLPPLYDPNPSSPNTYPVNFVAPQSTDFSQGCYKPYYWVDTFSHGSVPSTALHGGHDVDGAQIFVGRAFHEGDWLPAKVIPERNIAYVAYGGAEHAKHQYQVLCEQRFDWVPSSGGHVPPGAVEGGRTSDGESLYVGRVHHDGALTVGKVHPSHGVCYIPFDGREVGHHSYEILVLRN